MVRHALALLAALTIAASPVPGAIPVDQLRAMERRAASESAQALGRRGRDRSNLWRGPLRLCSRPEHQRADEEPLEDQRARALQLWAEAGADFTVRWEDATVRARAEVTLDASPTTYDVEVSLQTWCDGEPFAARSWSRSIPRDLG